MNNKKLLGRETTTAQPITVDPILTVDAPRRLLMRLPILPIDPSFQLSKTLRFLYNSLYCSVRYFLP